MYFDHVRCPACNSSFDPEAVEVRDGSMSCPACGSQLALKSLFGLSAAFDEEEPEQMTIDDLVPMGGRPSPPPAAPPPPSLDTPRRAPPRARRALPDAADPRTTSEGKPGDGSSVLDALRKIKKGGR